jgi:hypothetical protein
VKLQQKTARVIQLPIEIVNESGCIFKPCFEENFYTYVAKIWCCSNGFLTSIDEVVRGKTNLACLYCGGSLTAKKGSVKEHHFAHTAETCKPVSQRIKTKAFPSLPLYDNFNIQLKGEELEQLKVLWKCDSLISESR